MEHRMACQQASKVRSDMEANLAEAEKEERIQREKASVMSMERARAEEECDVKTKKARQVSMACDRCKQEQHRLDLMIAMLSAWIEEDKHRDEAEEEKTYRDFALFRQEHIHQEVQRCEDSVQKRTNALQEASDRKEKAHEEMEHAQCLVTSCAKQVADQRVECRKVHDDAQEAKLVELKKDLEDAGDELNYARLEHDRLKEFDRFAALALERAQDRKNAAQRKCDAAGDEAAQHDDKHRALEKQADDAEVVRCAKAEELQAAEEEPLIEVPEVREKVPEAKVMVGRSVGQKLWGTVRNTFGALNAFRSTAVDPSTLTPEEQEHALNEVVSEELDRVHLELEASAAEDEANISANRWRMKYKYKYYYKYKSRAEEEAGLQQAQVLGQGWDLDPAVGSLEDKEANQNRAAGFEPESSPMVYAAEPAAIEATPTSDAHHHDMAPASPAHHNMASSHGFSSPPQLGRGDLDADEYGSPDTTGEQGQAEFYILVEELEAEQVAEVEKKSLHQAATYLKKIHSTGLQNKEYRTATVPLQRSMRRETLAWANLQNIIAHKGVDEVQRALEVQDVTALTSRNIGHAVKYLSNVLEVDLVKGEDTPAKRRGEEARKNIPWDSSVTPAGRKRYLDKHKKDNVTSDKKGQEKIDLRMKSLQSPEKFGWDHDVNRGVNGYVDRH